MVHRGVTWEHIRVKKDPYVRYVFVFALVHSLTFVIMGIYNSPPSTMGVLKEAMLFMSEYPGAYIICMGDFNMWLNPTMDRFGKKIQQGMVGSNVLETFIKEVGWFDLWRIRNPNVRSYLWHA